jgi:DNA-binding SARP family transcriptional activator
MADPIRLHLARHAVLADAQGRRHTLGTPAALLAARLALAGPQPRAALAALLWPHAGEARARANLRQLLLRLRTLAGRDWIDGDALLALAADVEVFDGADDSPLLDGLALGGLDEAQRWLDAQRGERLKARVRLRATALAQAEADGRLDDAIDAAQHIVRLEPLAEAHHRALMRLHYLNHDRAQALAAHAALERMLADEHGAQPSGETRALLQLVQSTVDAAPPPTRVPAALQRPPRLVGRDAEMNALLRHLHGSQVAVLQGEGGLGKSRLLADALRQVARGDERATLTVGARPGDGAIPYALAARCAHALLAGAGSCTAATRTALAPLLGERTGPPGGDPTRHIVQAFTTLLRDAAALGLRVVALDDLHLADAASIDLLMPQVASGHCAWLLALRPAEAVAATAQALATLEAQASTLSITLHPLDRDAVAALLDTLALQDIGDPARAPALHRHTGGNPMYVLETLRAALEQAHAGRTDADAPWPHAPGVLRLIQQRLARLSPLALKIARCAAVAGADFTSALVSRVLGVPPLDLAGAWAELEAAQILGARGFAHDLIAEAVQAGLPAGVAEPLHAEVAARLSEAEAEPAHVADHWLAAGEPMRAEPYLRDAAARASALWRRREAAALHRRRAAILQAAGQRDAAFDAWFDAADIAMDYGDVDDARACEHGLTQLARGPGQAVAAAYLGSWLQYHLDRQDEALSVARQALPAAAHAPAKIQVLLLQHLSTMLWERREVIEALDLAERGLARIDAASADDTYATVRSLRLALASLAGMAACGLARYDQGCARIEQAWRIACEERELTEIAYATRLLAVITLFRGDRAAASTWADRAFQAMHDADQAGTTQEAYVCAAQMGVHIGLGDLGAALAASDRVEELQRLQPTGPVVFNAEERSVLMAELGRADLARAAVPALPGGDATTEVQQARRTAARAGLGLAGADEIESMLDHAARSDDFNLRARLLWMAQPGCAPRRIEPLLADAAERARACGGHGLWAMLQARRLASLRALRDAARADEARAISLDLWPQIEQGLGGLESFARTGAELSATLAPTDPDLAETIALRVGGWMLKAAATLPSGWRENYLARSAVLDVLPPRGRSALRGLGLATAGAAVNPRRSPG